MVLMGDIKDQQTLSMFSFNFMLHKIHLLNHFIHLIFNDKLSCVNWANILFVLTKMDITGNRWGIRYPVGMVMDNIR